MKLYLIFSALLCLSSATACSDELNDQNTNASIKAIARQRDKAIEERDYWAKYADRKCRDFKAMEIDEKTDSAVILQVTGAKPDAKFTMVELDNPDRSVCVVKIGDECVFSYDGQSHSFMFTRPLDVKVK